MAWDCSPYTCNEQHRQQSASNQPLEPSMHMSPLLLSGVQCAQMSEQTQDHRSVGKVLTWNICHCSQTVMLRRTFTFAVRVAVRTTTWDKMCCNNSKKEFSYSVYQNHTYHVVTNIGRKLNLADWWFCEICQLSRDVITR